MTTKKTTASKEAEDTTTEVTTSSELSKVNPLEIIAIADAAFDLLEKALAAIDGAKKNGANITPEQQQALQARYASLRERTDGQFTGDHWHIAPPPSVESRVRGA